MGLEFEVTSDAGLKKLNEHLATRSYIVGYQATTADVAVFTAFDKAPDAKKYPHAARWYSHVASFTGPQKTHLPNGAVTVKKGGKVAASPKAAPAKAAAKPADDDDFDLFGDDDEEADAENEARLKAIADAHKAKLAAAGKSKKVVGKSSVVFELKPWEDTTPLDKMEELARKVEMEGLTWGAAKKAPIGYGIFKLVLMCTIVDDLVSTDALQEALEGNGDEDDVNDLAHYVQSVDIAAFNKI